jgi:DNA-binding MarR family transcriptional regulator
MSTEQSSILKKIKRLTSGGRSLNAIHLNKNLNQIEKHLMLVLAGLLDFRGLDEECSFGDVVLTIPVNQIAIRMSITRRYVISYINKLSAKGYVTKKQNFSTDDKRQIESTYMLTDQIFVEYAAELGLDLDAMSSCGECSQITGGVSDGHHYLPNSAFNDPEKNPPTKPGVPDFVVPPTTDQVGISQDVIHEENKLELIEAIEDIKPEPKKRKPKAPKYKRPPVTQSHQKMVRIFTPKPELKSFVHRNDILFAVDELIQEYGEISHDVIDYLYRFLKSKNRCGEYRWIDGQMNKFFITALEEMKGTKNEHP